MTPAREIALVAVAAALAALRVGGVKTEAFQAAAHLFVGGLLGAAAGRSGGWKKLLGLAAVLSLIELACFLVGLL